MRSDGQKRRPSYLPRCSPFEGWTAPTGRASPSPTARSGRRNSRPGPRARCCSPPTLSAVRAGLRACFETTGWKRSPEHPKRTGLGLLLEPIRQGSPVDQIWWPATVGGVGKDIVDGKQAAGQNVRCPALVVRLGRLQAVAAVDEDHR